MATSNLHSLEAASDFTGDTHSVGSHTALLRTKHLFFIVVFLEIITDLAQQRANS